MKEQRRPSQVDRRLRHGAHHAFGMVLRCCENFRDGNVAVAVLRDEVGESAADIYPNELHVKIFSTILCSSS